jgi:hypothetical protein
MSKHIFINKHDYPIKGAFTLSVESSAENLDKLLEDFTLYLKGCGFEFDGQLEIVPPYSDKEEIDND